MPNAAGSPVETAETSGTEGTDPARERARYLAQVMSEIDAEVVKRRASGDIPPGLERELDELFLEFSPVGMQGRTRLRETLQLVDGNTYVDIAVPTESRKAVGSYIKRLIRKSVGWYLNFIVQQIVRFAWAVSRALHVVVDHVEDLEAEVAALRPAPLPELAVPAGDDGRSWWAPLAAQALAATGGRVLHADCGNGSLVAGLVAAGIDAYGVDPDEVAVEVGMAAHLDLRAETGLDHLDVVSAEALDGIVLSGSLQWLLPAERERLVSMASSRLAPGGVIVLHSATPEAWLRTAPPVLADLAPGRPLHSATWELLFARQGLRTLAVHGAPPARRLDRVDPATEGAAALNATIDAVNELLSAPAEYLLVVTRDR